jgi:hypothetical protein
VSSTDRGRFVSLAATVHLSRRFADSAEQHRYAIVAAPRLRRGQRPRRRGRRRARAAGA